MSEDGVARIVVSDKVETPEPTPDDSQKKDSGSSADSTVTKRKTSTQGLVATGDSQLLAVSICAAFGLLAIAEGLRRLRARL